MTFPEDSVDLYSAGTHFEPFKRTSRYLALTLWSSLLNVVYLLHFCPILWYYLPISKQQKNILLNMFYTYNYIYIHTQVYMCLCVCYVYNCTHFSFYFGNPFFKNPFFGGFPLFIYFFLPSMQHTEVPGPGRESEPLQLWSTPQLQQCQILNPLCQTRDQTYASAKTMLEL